METSASRSAEKKDKMDGSGFPDLPKKPSETRGNTPIQRGNCVSNVASGSVSVVVVVGGAGGKLSPGLTGAPPGGQRGSRHGAMKYTFQKGKVPILGADVPRLSSSSTRPRQQSEVTYGGGSDVNPKQTLALKRASLIPHQGSDACTRPVWHRLRV